MSIFRPSLALGLTGAVLASCTLGPDYQHPQDPAAAAPGTPLYRAQQMTRATPPQRWWEQLQDPILTQLEEQALAGSPNLQALEGKVQAARELINQRRAESLPSIGANAAAAKIQSPQYIEHSVHRFRDRAASTAQTYAGPEAAKSVRDRFDDDDLNPDLYHVGFDATWELDLFGRRRRATEQAVADAQADLAELADAQVQLAAELGQAYLNYRGTQQRLTVAQNNLAAAKQSVALTQQRYRGGTGTDLEVQRALGQQHQQEQSIPQLQGQLQQARDQLALMVGREPGALDRLLLEPRPLPVLPQHIPVDDAGAVLRRRPDVRRAERQLAASSAQIGQAMTAWFPRVTLLGALGMTVGSPGDFASDAASALVAPVLQWSAFDFGRNKARLAQARAGNAAQLANYQGTVLAALQDANDALTRFGSARSQLAVAERAQQTTRRAFELTEQRRRAGVTSLIDLLDVQRQRLQSEDGTTQAQIQLLVNYVALQKSLGLGWQLPKDQPQVASTKEAPAKGQ